MMSRHLLCRFLGRTLSLGLVIASLYGVQGAQATILFNEILINPPGTDNGQEFFELRSSTGGVESMSGLHLLIIEGDGPPNMGTIDQALDLGSFSTGTNGLFLWRDAASIISPAPEAATVVHMADFNPDIENGSNTFVLVSGFSGAQGTDLDANDDGVLDMKPWASVVGGIAFRENDGSGNFDYAQELGLVAFAPNAGFNPDTIQLLGDGSWFSSDVLGTNPGGPYEFDATRNQDLSGALLDVSTWSVKTITPGSLNATVPEPTGLALLISGVVVFGARRRA